MTHQVSVEDVKRWYVEAGIGHIVLGSGSLGGGWLRLACPAVCSGDESNTTTVRPKRICRLCRANLPRLKPIEKGVRTGGAGV